MNNGKGLALLIIACHLQIGFTIASEKANLPKTNTITTKPSTAKPSMPIPAAQQSKQVNKEPSQHQQPGKQPVPNEVKTTEASNQPKVMDCNYRISTPDVAADVILQWTEKALTQSFDFDYTKINEQLENLKACFTKEGFEGFNEALKKSGNLNTIKQQKIVSTSNVNGKAKLIEGKGKQWKINVPLQVIYKNDKEKSVQNLTIDVLVERNSAGGLGIMQIIAMPQALTKNKEPKALDTPSKKALDSPSTKVKS